jgi:hypothetical protein
LLITLSAKCSEVVLVQLRRGSKSSINDFGGSLLQSSPGNSFGLVMVVVADLILSAFFFTNIPNAKTLHEAGVT